MCVWGDLLKKKYFELTSLVYLSPGSKIIKNICTRRKYILFCMYNLQSSSMIKVSLRICIYIKYIDGENLRLILNIYINMHIPRYNGII